MRDPDGAELQLGVLTIHEAAIAELEVGFIDTPGDVWGVAVAGSVAYPGLFTRFRREGNEAPRRFGSTTLF